MRRIGELERSKKLFDNLLTMCHSMTMRDQGYVVGEVDKILSFLIPDKKDMIKTNFWFSSVESHMQDFLIL